MKTIPRITALACAFLIVFFVTMLILHNVNHKVVVRIGSIEITQDEFQDMFSRSSFYHAGRGKFSKREFLDNLIERKLILKEAEKISLDKDKNFLSSIQDFWEQSLLKLMLERKIKELSADIVIDDEDVSSYYKTHIDDFQGKGIEDVYENIKYILFKLAQKEKLDEWVSGLQKSADIYVDEKSIGLEE